MAVACQNCQRRVTYKSGIICANYGHPRGPFPACRNAWCARCFKAHPLDDFEVRLPQDFNGATLAEVEDEVRFKYARAGDHLITPFQCPCCQSQNIRGKSLVPGDASDAAFESLCIRAYLDAFWSRSSRTIAKHVTEVGFC